jgi:phenylpropionate dioxygenase-like ring-hydroxylating dioxygenase large terminal subunit
LQNFDNEWYVVCISDEIKRGKKRGITLFGRNIVVWRHRDGHVSALDAKCPHMGASLAVGRVIDDNVECPYHGFQYDETGRCVHTPLRKSDALIPKTLCTRRYAVTERDGWVFLFWGEAEANLPPPTYFEHIEGPLLHAWSTREWPISFTRFIENTVDIAHLGTVHRSTLRWTIPKTIDVSCKVDGNLISVFPPSSTDLNIVSEIVYPNLALLKLHPKFIAVFVAVPIDSENCRIYVRSSQGFVRLPVIGQIVTLLKHWLDMAALWQDEQAAFTVDPRNADDAKGEVLLEFDDHIAQYRKMRRRRLAELKT